ncbi:ClpP/crotonase [Polyporus arcularius HHB13444]|uniref:ClpP/crotonase n=1 Tax=Polyporus arcularius HHB13444 TaxID=1314778 RepID=A0A5C3PWU6_9APHY|nr:ClpP/crotonase [Polyporus arcularius HHB13444]
MSYPVSYPATNPLVTVTNPSPAVWVIEIHNGTDNRLTDVLITQALKPALDTVERHWRENWRSGQAQKDESLCKGSLILVGNTKQDKFFSNGLDWAGATKDPSFKTNFFPVTFNPLLYRLLTFPIPTIAAVNGHSFAAGMVLAMACDYRVMTDGSKRNAWMCMNEIHFGAAIPNSLIAVLKAKASNSTTLRKIVLEGHRFTPQEALSLGLVDHIVNGNSEAILTAAQTLAEKVGPIAKSGAWGVNKRELYRDAIESLSRDVQLIDVLADDAAAKARL